MWATRNTNTREERKWRGSGNNRLGLIPGFSKDPKQLQIPLKSLCQGLRPIPDPSVSRLAAVSWGMSPESALSPWSLVPGPKTCLVLNSECCRHDCVATKLSQAALCASALQSTLFDFATFMCSFIFFFVCNWGKSIELVRWPLLSLNKALQTRRVSWFSRWPAEADRPPNLVSLSGLEFLHLTEKERW